MFIGEPPATQYDWNFSLLGISVRVHPFFWVVALILGVNLKDPKLVLIWMVVVFVSIVIHEFGHALTMRRLGLNPHVVLYSFGGLAIADRNFGYGRRETPQTNILISFAGPAAGFLFAGLLLGLIVAGGGIVELNWRGFPIFWDVQLIPVGLPAGFQQLEGLDRQLALRNQLIEYRWLYVTVFFLLQVNILWGLVNLLPIYPLDGGQIARELLTVNDPWKGVVHSLWLSIFSAGLMVIYGLTIANSFYIALMFGLLAYSSYQTLQQMTGGGNFGGGWR